MDFKTFNTPTNLSFKMDNIVKVSYQINSLIINSNCSIMIIFHDINGDRFYRQIILSGDDYKNWKDDDYIVNYLNSLINKMIE
jgi:hypothetical protein